MIQRTIKECNFTQLRLVSTQFCFVSVNTDVHLWCSNARKPGCVSLGDFIKLMKEAADTVAGRENTERRGKPGGIKVDN